ncbi:unnamed protein product [Protopolystoma xenopodis]|uniref:Uncharacterized protein n=1 Tax=Protopolystoma xenopodis TaxID=117903 RepID=A0A448WXN5_9PLAT|nr:unnamed protein product [Protopolystoma xenopodis]
MARLTDDADYDAGKTSRNVPRTRSYSGNDDAYNGLLTRCVLLSLPNNMTELRKQGQTTSICNIVDFIANMTLLRLQSHYRMRYRKIPGLH